MKGNAIRATFVAIILLAVYHLVVFLVPFDQSEVFWISYGFTLAAFAVVAASVYIAFGKEPKVKSRFYGFPIARIGVIYGLVQLVVSLIVMALEMWFASWVVLLIYAIGLGAALIGLISADAVVAEIERQDNKQKADTSLMRSLHSKVSQIAAQSENPAIKALANELRYSDPVSNAAIREAEADLAAAVDQLQAAYIEGDEEAVAQLCRKATAMLGERNRLCKLNKN